MPKRSNRTSCYQIRISLKDSPLPIWRRLLVQSDLTLDVVHEVFQIAMGWWDTHLYDFQVAGRHFGDLSTSDGDDEVEDSGEFSLQDVLKKVGDKLQYDYDFGDSWSHEVILEKILQSGKYDDGSWAKCLHGKRAGPPEDCGGIHGFTELIAAAEDPLHPQRKELLDWVGCDYNPDAFDARTVNLRLILLQQEKEEEEQAWQFFSAMQNQSQSSEGTKKSSSKLKLLKSPTD